MAKQTMIFHELVILLSITHISGFHPAFEAVTGLIEIHDFIHEFYHTYVKKDASEISWNVEDSVKAINNLESKLYTYFGSFQDILKVNAEQQQFHESMNRIKHYSQLISNQLKNSMKIKARLDKNELEDPEYFSRYADTLIRGYIVESPLQMIHSIVRDDFSNVTFLSTPFIKKYEYFGDVCKTHASPLQLLNRLFHHLQFVSAEFYANVEISYDILSNPKVLNSTRRDESNVKRKQFSAIDIIDEYKETINQFKEYLPQVSRAVYACEPQRHIANETFYEMKITRRMFLEVCHGSTYDNSDLGNFGATKKFEEKTCESVTNASKMCNNYVSGQICPVGQICEGKITCEILEEDTTVCLDASNSTSHSYERYFPTKMKEPTDCKFSYTLKQKPVQEVFEDGKYASGTCKPCRCVCEEGIPEYYFSTDIVSTDTTNHMVITGVKLQLSNDILVIRVQQGKLLPNGTIDSTTISWLPSSVNSKEHKTGDGKKISKIELMRLTTIDPGSVMTGIGFVLENDGKIGLMGRFKKYDFRAGLLSDYEDRLESSPHSKSELELIEAHNPTLMNGDSPVQMERGKFVSFTPSSGKDGGRSTIPFIGGQEVVPNPLTPLSGAGLYFRGRNNSGGFIGIELLTYNIVPFIAS